MGVALDRRVGPDLDHGAVGADASQTEGDGDVDVGGKALGGLAGVAGEHPQWRAHAVQIDALFHHIWRAGEAAGRGARFLDTPVSGSIPHARAATLAIMAGGNAEALEAHRDVLEAIGKSVHHFGPNGAGLRMKLVTNHILSIQHAAIAEGLTLGKKTGLEPARMVEFLKNSAIPHLLEYKAPPMIEGDFSPSFTVDLMRKDLRLIASMAGEAKVPILLSTLVREVYTGSTALGFGDRDINAIVKFFEQNAGM